MPDIDKKKMKKRKTKYYMSDNTSLLNHEQTWHAKNNRWLQTHIKNKTTKITRISKNNKAPRLRMLVGLLLLYMLAGLLNVHAE